MRTRPVLALAVSTVACAAWLSACSDAADQGKGASHAAAGAKASDPTAAQSPQPAAAPPAAAIAGGSAPGAGADASASPALARINDASFSPTAAPKAQQATGGGQPDPALVKAQVLLARAGFSPGEIDGLPGSNMRRALTAYAKANGLPVAGDLTPDVWSRLTGQGGGPPVAATYRLTEADVAGPWAPDTHGDIAKAKGLPELGFTHATEALGERFHMSEDLLKALNAGTDFTKAGAAIVVAQVGEVPLPKVDHLDVDKADAQVRAYDEGGKLIAAFPATVGSTERPSPSGVHKVVGVARAPDYVYDPSKLSWGPKKLGRFVVKPGPNNPVGAVWIDLNAPSYGLHGTPDPHEVGKSASHGCVRMTNWDATLLASAVKPGVKVTFLNKRG